MDDEAKGSLCIISIYNSSYECYRSKQFSTIIFFRSTAHQGPNRRDEISFPTKMSAKAIKEFDGKHLLSHFIPQKNPSCTFLPPTHLAAVHFDLSILSSGKKAFDDHVKQVLLGCEKDHDWLKTTKLVCKPDQLIKRRGKNGLLGINLDWEAVKKWIIERAGTVIHVLNLFLILD
jgi:hypothetical protein